MNEYLKGLIKKRLTELDGNYQGVPYSDRLISSLFKKYNTYLMVEESYCCCGLEQSCWGDLVEEGNWCLTLGAVKESILDDINQVKRYLYRGGRLYVSESENECNLFIFARDKVKKDYIITFYNRKLAERIISKCKIRMKTMIWFIRIWIDKIFTRKNSQN